MKFVYILLLGLVASSFGRVIVSNVNVNRQRAWIASAKYPPNNVPEGKVNNMFAAVFGNKLPGVGDAPPYVSVTFARGTGSLRNEDNAFEGSATGLIFSYNRLGEYCEMNGVAGYQPDGDLLLQNYTWYQANWNDIQAGETDGVYWATLSESTGTFFYTCRVSTADRIDGGVNIGPYSLKCDVIVNATNFWTSDAQGCADSNRYIGLLAFIAAAHVSTDVNDNDNSGQAAVTIDDAQSFFKWKKTVENGQTGVSYNVSAQFKDVTDSFPNLPSQVKSVREGVFCFLTPKSETNIFVWDPEMGVDQAVAESGASVLSTLYALVFAMAVLLIV